MIDALLDPLRQGITQRALLDLLILGSVCGPLGVWVVLYRQSYAAESIAHSMLPGLVAAVLIGVPLGFGAALGLAVAAAAIAFASRQASVGADVAVAVAVTALFGLGTLLALSPEVPLRLGELLFGDPLAVSGGDLLASGIVALAALAALTAGHRTLSLSGFDPDSAPSLGGSPARATALLLGLLALTTLISVFALGNLLVVAIVIGPSVAALRLCSRLLPALLAAAVLAILAGTAGVYLSYYANLAAGASIALCAVAVFILSLLAGRPDAGTRRAASPVGALGGSG
jgi:ABC-type Mn2+/Zn2+ transport system permease subunit